MEARISKYLTVVFTVSKLTSKPMYQTRSLLSPVLMIPPLITVLHRLALVTASQNFGCIEGAHFNGKQYLLCCRAFNVVAACLMIIGSCRAFKAAAACGS